MKNPWLNISWDNPIAESDRIRIEERYGSVDAFEKKYEEYGLKLRGALPEPYSGNKDSKVYCLNMNPGKWISDFDGSESMLEMTVKNLRHEVEDYHWWNQIKDKDGNKHNGAKWTDETLNGIKKILGNRNPCIFFVEYLPYHSDKGFDFPSYLPSYDYTDHLIMEAMKQKKYIIVMRCKKRWFNRIPQLENYEKIILPHTSRRGWISPKNLGLEGQNDLIRDIF